MSDLIDSFLMAREAEGRSQRTLVDYGKYLRTFDAWLGAPSVAELAPTAVTKYIAERRRTSPHAARYACAVLKAFASWLARMEYLATPVGTSVLAGVKTP